MRSLYIPGAGIRNGEGDRKQHAGDAASFPYCQKCPWQGLQEQPETIDFQEASTAKAEDADPLRAFGQGVGPPFGEELLRLIDEHAYSCEDGGHFDGTQPHQLVRRSMHKCFRRLGAGAFFLGLVCLGGMFFFASPVGWLVGWLASWLAGWLAACFACFALLCLLCFALLCLVAWLVGW